MTYGIGVIGRKNNISGFKAVGFEIRPCDDRQGALSALKELSGSCAIIYVTEDIAALIPEEMHYFDSRSIPAVIILPTSSGSTGIGMKQLNESVEKAIGSNILNNG